MNGPHEIPLFPLGILLLKDEVVPLHIFEQRYRQLFQDVEKNGLTFGILFTHPENNLRLGSLVQLENITRRYPGGELDGLVRCTGHFALETFHTTLPGKLYPGGKVKSLQLHTDHPITAALEYYIEDFKTRFPYDPFPVDRATDLESLGAALKLEDEKKLRLLTLASAEERAIFLLKELQLLENLLEQEHATFKGIYLN
jgi:hypothetical protein